MADPRRLAAKVGNAVLILPANLFLYLWFGGSYVCFFMWCHLVALTFGGERRERAFQVINSWFYATFVNVMRIVLPGLRIQVDPKVRDLRGAVFVANHLSFFDTLLVMRLYRRQKTITKGVMFKVPFLGWAQNLAGYLPSHTRTPFYQVLTERLANLKRFFAGGGVFFVFPEGTRSRTGELGPFLKGAFNIAAHAGAPVEIVRIENSHRVQPVGMFLAFVLPFPGAPVKMTHVATLPATRDHQRESVLALMKEAEEVLREAVSR